MLIKFGRFSKQLKLYIKFLDFYLVVGGKGRAKKGKGDKKEKAAPAMGEEQKV